MPARHPKKNVMKSELEVLNFSVFLIVVQRHEELVKKM